MQDHKEKLCQLLPKFNTIPIPMLKSQKESNQFIMRKSLITVLTQLLSQSESDRLFMVSFIYLEKPEVLLNRVNAAPQFVAK